MKEMLVVGRGGQGVVLASQLLADTFARAGYWVQSFPEFKAERRGAPISAFLRWDETSPIHRRYRVRIATFSSSSPPRRRRRQILRRVRPGGLVLLNRETRLRHTGPFEIARVPASRIARRQRRPLLGGPADGKRGRARSVRPAARSGRAAFLEQAIRARMGARAEANVLAAGEGYARCTRQRTLAGDTPVEPAPTPPGPARRRARPVYAVSTTDSLLNHTGSWSMERPVFTANAPPARSARPSARKE